MAKKKDGAGFNAPWEDSLIIAVRDLQWRKALERLLAGRRSALPTPLFKFGGTPENAIGDVGLSVHSLFYLLEFKRDSKRAYDEFDKPLVTFMKQVAAAAESKVRARFIEHSQRGHHFVFAEQGGAVPKAAGENQTVAINIQSAPYYDEAVQMTKTGYEMTARTEISKLLYSEGESTSGLTVSLMLGYIAILISAHSAAKGNADGDYPFKGVLLSDRGFFWPLANLDALGELQVLLEGRFDKDIADAGKVEYGRMEKILHVVPPATKAAAKKNA